MNQYPLPEGWRWAKLGDVFEYLQYGVSQKSNREKKGYPILGMGNIKGGKLIISDLRYTELPKLESDKYILKRGDILINRTNSAELVGKSAVFDLEGDYVFASYLIRLRVKASEADPYFINFGINSFIGRDYVSRVARRAIGQVNINSKEIGEMSIPLCSLSEQRRIAKKIQELMQDVDRARTACEKELESANAFPAAYLREVFESEEAKKWSLAKLADACRVFSGSPAPQDQKYFVNGKHPFVRVQDLGKSGRTTSLVDIKDYINDIAIKELSLVKAEKGTILFPKSGAAITTNNRAILGISAFIVSHLAAIKPIREVADYYYVYYWLCSVDFAQFMENLGYPSLKLSTISKISIPLPPLPEQRRIAVKIQELMQEVDRARTVCEKQHKTILSLPDIILRRAFRGEI